MARVVALIPDLLFGSRVQADLTAAGHAVELVGSVDAANERLGDADVLLVDLTDEQLNGASFAESIRGRSGDSRIRTIGFYSHVDTATRERAEEARFDRVIPRSRMAREGASIVSRLAEGR